LTEVNKKSILEKMLDFEPLSIILGYLQNEVGKYFYAERKIYSVLCKKWLKNITTHDMLFHAI